MIASNVNREFALGHQYQFEASVSGWQILLDRLRPWRRQVVAPSLVEIMLRVIEFNSVPYLQADILVEPPVEHFGTLDFRAVHEMVEAGYQSCREQLVRWQARR